MSLSLTNPEIIAIATVLVLLMVGLAWLYIHNIHKRRTVTAGLRQRFGTEYDRTVEIQGSERKGQVKLRDREKRVEKLKIRELDPAERVRFVDEWKSVQSRFVDSPIGAVAEADNLVSFIMQTRGYPVSDFEQSAADISVDHPRVTENYRAAHAIALRVDKSETSTEELRTAIVHYRSLFDELVEARPVDAKNAA
jgi:hypothetical protein